MELLEPTNDEILDVLEKQTEETAVPEYLPEEEALKVEFDLALKKAAEERAATPFLAAAQQHAMMWRGFEQRVDNLTSAHLKRIVKYLTGYPFYIKEMETLNKEALGVCYISAKLVETKNAMILCRAIEQEARVVAALDAEEAKIMPLNLTPDTEEEEVK